MNVYLDKDFLADFEKLNADSDNIYQIVKNIFTEYPQVKLFSNININIENIYEFEDAKKNSEIINLYSSKNSFVPEFLDIEESLEKIDIVFCYKQETWFKKAKEKGVLCFHFDNFRARISEIVKIYHYRIDLLEPFTFELLKFVPPITKIEIEDNYILVDGDNQKIKDNLVPLLEIITKKAVDTLEVDIFTIVQQKKQVYEDAEKFIITRFCPEVNSLKSVRFRLLDVSSQKDFFHDRMILSNFQIIESGKGFNLLPYKESNSIITSCTIFDFFTYKRMKRLKLNNQKNLTYLQKKHSDELQLEYKFKKFVFFEHTPS